MKIFSNIGMTSDHAGVEIQKFLVSELKKQGYHCKEFGLSQQDTVSLDYPDCAGPLAKELSLGLLEAGIAICGTGIGMAIIANKYKGVRAASVWNEKVAKLSRQHNDVNFLCLGARELSQDKILQIVSVWLTTSFEEGRHKTRVDKIRAVESQNFRA